MVLYENIANISIPKTYIDKEVLKMDKRLIEEYKKQMLNMYKTGITIPVQTTVEKNESSMADGIGGLVAIVTSLRRLYPVPNAKVTVFTGNIEDKQIVATDVTDSSGRTGVIRLNTPIKEQSQQADRNALPYASYNMLVEADGYIDNIHLNVPVFSGVVSLQGSDMMLIETAGVDKDAQIFNEEIDYNL